MWLAFFRVTRSTDVCLIRASPLDIAARHLK
jgi:hypothetical protein